MAPQGGIIGTAPAVQFIGDSGGTAGSATILTQSAAVEASAVEMEGRTVGWQVQGTSDVSEFLRRMNAERIHLEQGLQREEESETHKVLKTHVRLSKSIFSLLHQYKIGGSVWRIGELITLFNLWDEMQNSPILLIRIVQRRVMRV